MVLRTRSLNFYVGILINTEVYNIPLIEFLIIVDIMLSA